MGTERQNRVIRNDIEEIIERSRRALKHFDAKEYEKVEEHMEEVHNTADYVLGEMQTLPDPEEKKETAETPTETTPLPQSSPPEPTPVPAGSPE